MKRKIKIVSMGRKQSERCPNKMLRKFGNTTLTDILLSKLACFGEDGYFGGYENDFKVKCQKHGVNFIQRDRNSVIIDEPIIDILAFLKKLDADYLLFVNACMPFLSLETINAFLDECKEKAYESAFSIIPRNNFFITLEDRKPLNFDLSMKTINTKQVNTVCEFVHGLYFFNKDYFFKHGRYWDWKEVKFIELTNKLELIDIDTEEDFQLAENLFLSDIVSINH